MLSYPLPVASLLSEHNLNVKAVYRDGPRYWVGLVDDGQELLLLKAVIDRTTWISPATGEELSPVDQLHAEIVLFSALDQASVVAADPDNSWIVRKFYEGIDMAAGASPFVFRDDFFEASIYLSVLDQIQAYQALTGALRPALAKTGLGSGGHHVLAQKMAEINVKKPGPALAPFAERMVDYLRPLQKMHDQQLGTLNHGQLYPPHIIRMEDGRIQLIDWENASLNNAMEDYAALYIRGFAHPQWQEEFVAELHKRGLLTDKQDRDIWNIEVLLQSAGNLNYLHWSQDEDDDTKRIAVASLTRNIENILGGAK